MILVCEYSTIHRLLPVRERITIEIRGCVPADRTANAAQRDIDGDGIGNACDPDIAPVPVNDCVVNFEDLGMLKNAFFSVPGDTNWNPDADFNGDDFVNFDDLATMRASFFEVPGPGGVSNNCDDT